LYASPNIIRVTKSTIVIMGRACNMHGRDEKCIKMFVTKHEGKS